MIKLNSKGITTIEVIICFVLISIISVGLFSTVKSFEDKKRLEDYKEQISTYKYQITKLLQDDFIHYGILSVRVCPKAVLESSIDSTTGCHKTETTASNPTTLYQVDITLKDNSKRQLLIKQKMGYSEYHLNGYKDYGTGGDSHNADDYYMIEYGNPTKADTMIEYPLPELGDTIIEEQKIMITEGETPIEKTVKKHTVKDLSINNIQIKVSNDKVLNIYIGLYHPELTTKYAINITAPINY